MDKRRKLDSIDKILREFEDLKNSQTSLLKKLAQLEAENINVGISMLDSELGGLHEQTDAQLTKIVDLTEKLQDYRDDFEKKNKLNVVEEA